MDAKIIGYDGQVPVGPSEKRGEPMYPSTPDDVFELVDGYVVAAATGAAMERGLFWILMDEPLPAAVVADTLGIPVNRCRPWLELVAGLGLLDRSARGYVTSATARTTILDTASRETWSFLAREARESLAVVTDLARRLSDPDVPSEIQHTVSTDYVTKMREDPGRAEEFTRMLYEIHLPLAEELATTLPVSGLGRLLDVGGGSGVMSFALLRRFPKLEAVVLDISTVCAVGRQIAAEHHLQDRIDYQPCEFLEKDLPVGFDMILYCDVSEYNEVLFDKFRSSLRPGGLVVIVNKFGTDAGLSHPSRAHRALLRSLSESRRREVRAHDVEDMLRTAGFKDSSTLVLPDLKTRWSSGWSRITART